MGSPPSGSVPIPISNSAQSYRSGNTLGSYGQSPPVSLSLSYSTASHLGGSGSGGWSLPNSSVRSSSVSASSSDEDVDVVDGDGHLSSVSGYTLHQGYNGIRGHGYYGRKHDEEMMNMRLSVREEEEDEDVNEDRVQVKHPQHPEAWDGMDLDMDMD